MIIHAYRWLITVLSFILLSIMVTFDPDGARALLNGAETLASKVAEPFTGHAGLLADVLAAGLPVLLTGLILVVGLGLGFVTEDRRCITATWWLMLLPIVAQAVKIGLAYKGWDGWLITAGRNINDSLPRTARSWGNLVGLEGHLQLLIMMMIIMLAWQIVVRIAHRD